jgi:CRP-like cAMP-binding protein
LQDIIALVVRELVVERNEFIKFYGSVDTNVYYIAKGSVKMSINRDGLDQIIRFGYAGDLIVALDSYITGQASELAIQALKKSVIGVIPKLAMEEFIMRDIGNMLYWQSILESLILHQMHREIDLLTISPKDRYDRVLGRSSRLFQEVPSR